MRFLPALIFLVVISCSPETELDNSVQPALNTSIDSSVEPYLARFIREGEQRGYQNLAEAISQLNIEIVSIPDQGVAGLCTYNSHNPNHIDIDKEYWEQSSDLGKEFVLFHELGHCVLIRDHLEGCTNNRFYISIMRSGLGSCRDAYNANNREYYLDELFSISGDWEI